MYENRPIVCHGSPQGCLEVLLRCWCLGSAKTVNVWNNASHLREKEGTTGKQEGWMGKEAKKKRERRGSRGGGGGMRTAVSLTFEVMGIPCTARWGQDHHSGMLSRPPTPLADTTEVWILRQHRLPSSNSDPWARVPLVLSSHCVQKMVSLKPGASESKEMVAEIRVIEKKKRRREGTCHTEPHRPIAAVLDSTPRIVPVPDLR